MTSLQLHIESAVEVPIAVTIGSSSVSSVRTCLITVLFLLIDFHK